MLQVVVSARDADQHFRTPMVLGLHRSVGMASNSHLSQSTFITYLKEPLLG